MQKRFISYKAPLSSYDEDTRLLGILSPGRYRGFDTVNQTAFLSIMLSHDQTGIPQFDSNGNSVGKAAVIVTKQGVVIRETTSVGPFSFDSNAGNNSDRYDFIVVTHQYVPTVGGVDATYSVIKGPLNNPVFPALTDPNKQVIIGIMRIAANATEIVGGNYTRARTPDSGDEPDARLNEINLFTRYTGFKKASDTGPSFDPNFPTFSLMTLNNDGNVFPLVALPGSSLDGIRINNTPLQEGCSLTLIIDNTMSINNGRALSTDAVNAGYKSFVIPTAFTGPTGNLLPPPAGQKKIIELLYVENKFYVIYATSTGTQGGDSLVSAAQGDPAAGTLIDKIKPSTYIKTELAIDPATGYQKVEFKLGNDSTNFDNTWRDIPMGSLPAGWGVVASGTSPQYKIDYFGNIYLRGMLKYTGNIAPGTTINDTIFSLQLLSQNYNTRFNPGLEIIAASITETPLSYAQIDTSGNFKFFLQNMASAAQPISAVTVFFKGIILPGG